jgi:hypothetical protein
MGRSIVAGLRRPAAIPPPPRILTPPALLAERFPVMAHPRVIFWLPAAFELVVSNRNERNVTTPQTQQELEYKVDERDWTAIKLLIEELEQELAERHNHLLYRITAWCFALKIFKRVESEKLICRPPIDRDREYHRAMLAFLRGCGEILVLELKKHDDIDPQKIGMNFADFSAMVEELAISERERYGDMTPSRRDEILNDVFGQT